MDKMLSTKPPVTTEQEQALYLFAVGHGPDWRKELARQWTTNYSFAVAPHTLHLLQQVRNRWGVTALHEWKFPWDAPILLAGKEHRVWDLLGKVVEMANNHAKNCLVSGLPATQQVPALAIVWPDRWGLVKQMGPKLLKAQPANTPYECWIRRLRVPPDASPSRWGYGLFVRVPAWEGLCPLSVVETYAVMEGTLRAQLLDSYLTWGKPPAKKGGK